MGKVGALIAVVVLAVVGGRLFSQYQLQARVSDYREGLRRRALGSVPGPDSVPSEALIRERAQQLAQELQLELRDLETTVTRDAAPRGAGAMVADQLGSLPGLVDADQQGNVVVGEARKLRTTLLEVRGQVHAEGFLCSIDESVSANANIGYAIQ